MLAYKKTYPRCTKDGPSCILERKKEHIQSRGPVSIYRWQLSVAESPLACVNENIVIWQEFMCDEILDTG